MSTRSAILRPTEDGDRGVYHHWDGYPTGLGATLWSLYHGHFEQDLDVMLATLIDQHPAGWSTINDADWSLEPGFDESLGQPRFAGPKCYCHGDREEEANPITCRFPEGATVCDAEGCDPLFLEWEYVLHPDRMEVRTSRNDGKYQHHRVGAYPWDGPEPEWKLVESLRYDAESVTFPEEA